MQRKLLLLGIDGATWTRLDPLLAKGALPAFSKLIENGVRAPLKTFKPSASPALWTTIATGMPPSVHGIADFVVRSEDDGKTHLPTSNMRRVKALWNILSERGYSCGVVGWWATYPAERLNGFVISDQASAVRNESFRKALKISADAAAHSALLETHPASLRAELVSALALSQRVSAADLARFIKLPLAKLERLSAAQDIDDEDILSIFRFALAIDKSFIAAADHRLQRGTTDFTAIYLSGIDAAEHHFWRFLEPEKFGRVPAEQVAAFGRVIDSYYIYVDEVLARLMSLYSKDELTIVIVSDHGHQANLKFDPKSASHFDRVCSGTHEEAPDGVLVISGKDISSRAIVAAPTLFDVAPTVLALMGVPAGKDMLGRVLEEALSKEFLAGHPPSLVETHSAGYTYSRTPVPSAMGDDLKAKLKGLGYIEE